MTQCFPNALEPVDGPNGGQDVSRVGPLPNARLEELPPSEGVQHHVEKLLLGATDHQAAPELREHRGIKAGIVELQG